MNHLYLSLDATLIDVRNAHTKSSIVIVCEHASAHIPSQFDNLGLDSAALQSHVAWDPGALGVALGIATQLDAV